MKLDLRPYLKRDLAGKLFFGVVLVWAGFATLMAVRDRPQFILVGLDSNGTRLIVSQSDPLLAEERVKFIKEILFRLFNYDESNYEKQVTSAGDLMSDPLWHEQEKEFRRIALQIKGHPLRAETRLVDLRQLDDESFEADLSVHITERLMVHDTRLRVAITIGSRKRNVENPYAWEVTAYHENEIH